MTHYTAHIDTFAKDNLPPREQWPEFLFTLPELQYPERLNCATELLDQAVANQKGNNTVFVTPNERWTYQDLLEQSNRIAHVLREDFGLISGNRVLIRSANNPMFLACWFAVLKAGGIVVATMPLLRSKEISKLLNKAQIKLALCDERLSDDMDAAASERESPCERVCYFNGSGETKAGGELEDRMKTKSAEFDNVDTAIDDVALIAFTSGTTGTPKGTVHFHRDLMAICDCFPRSILKVKEEDVFIGSPPIAFTFGLGGLALFPMRFYASTVLLEVTPPETLLQAMRNFRASICFTAPTAYRRFLAEHNDELDLPHLRLCVSAGETLPAPTFHDWKERTGVTIIDGIGGTEMLHIFISTREGDVTPGSTGRAVPGYEARIVDEHMNLLPRGEMGRLAVRGPTGCRYLADERQQEAVREGWNLTGDAFIQDEAGYFWFKGRSDDIILSSGYNISGPEVEAALMAHDAVLECAVVGAPDEKRGSLVKAFIVLQENYGQSESLILEIQNFVKEEIAPYKYPRAIEFVSKLPKTETGKIKRFALR